MLTARQRPYAFPREHERYIDRKTICFKCTRERRGQADVHLLVCSAAISDLAIFDRHTIGYTSSSRCRKPWQTRFSSVCKLFAGQDCCGSRASSFDAPLVEPDGIEPTT